MDADQPRRLRQRRFRVRGWKAGEAKALPQLSIMVTGRSRPQQRAQNTAGVQEDYGGTQETANSGRSRCG